MIELLVFLGLAILILSAVMSVLLLFGIVPLIDGLNVLLRKIGLARASPETRASGQEHVGEVTHEFSWDPNVGKATGKVFVKGEIWNAECQPDLVDALPAGTRVRVLYEEDLLVRVLGKAV